MGLYEVMVLAHVAAAVVLLSGSAIASPAVRAAIRRAASVSEVRAYLSIGRPLLWLEPAAAGVVLVSGVYLSQAAGFWSQPWVQVAIVFWIVNAIVAAVLVKPVITRVAAAAASAGSSIGPELDAARQEPHWMLGGSLLMANDMAMLFVMVIKPELIGSLLAVVAANVGVLAAHALRGLPESSRWPGLSR